MFTLNNIIESVINKLNENGNILFNISPYRQQFYDNDILDLDNKHYIAGVINELQMPRIENLYTTRRREFTIEIKGVKSILNEVIDIIAQSPIFKDDELTFYLGDLIVNDERTQKMGSSVVSVFYGSITLGVSVPMYVVGSDITFKVDNQDLAVLNGSQIFDKSLISSVDFGFNTSDINTGSEHTFTIPLGSSNIANTIFTDIINNTYNRKYTFEIDYIVAVATIDLVLRSGSLPYTNNDNQVVFNATFERALNRKVIKINDEIVEAISFNPQFSVIPSVRNDKAVAKIKSGVASRSFVLYLANNKSQVIEDMLMTFKNNDDKTYTIDYEVNDIMFSYGCKITNIIIPNSENPNAIIQIVMAEGDL